MLFTAWAALGAYHAIAQPLRFVAADVYSSTLTDPSGALNPGARVSLHGATMAHLISLAYGIAEDRVLSGPKWIDVARFDVIAKAPHAATVEHLQEMLQQLLAERFQLKIRRGETPD
jgi:uncharacterized protein (TIGR03435 family)